MNLNTTPKNYNHSFHHQNEQLERENVEVVVEESTSSQSEAPFEVPFELNEAIISENWTELIGVQSNCCGACESLEAQLGQSKKNVEDSIGKIRKKQNVQKRLQEKLDKVKRNIEAKQLEIKWLLEEIERRTAENQELERDLREGQLLLSYIPTTPPIPQVQEGATPTKPVERRFGNPDCVAGSARLGGHSHGAEAPHIHLSRTVEPVKVKFVCCLCNKRLKNERGYILHVAKMHPEKR